MSELLTFSPTNYMSIRLSLSVSKDFSYLSKHDKYIRMEELTTTVLDFPTTNILRKAYGLRSAVAVIFR